MESLTDASLEALRLLITGDHTLWSIIAVSFTVSVKAILVSTPFALLLAFALAFSRFPGRRVLISFSNTFLSVPAVVVGLTLYLVLSRSGPLGDWKLLFTQDAMMIGQIVLCFPILVTMGHAAFQSADRRAWETAITHGAKPWRAMFTLMREVRFALLAAVIAGFGRIIAEVGSSIMVGGNILNYTRNIPTAIALETSKGAFAQGIALGVVLVTLSLTLNVLLTSLQGQGEMRT